MEPFQIFLILMVAGAALLGAVVYAAVVIPWRRQQEREIQAKQRARAEQRAKAAQAAAAPPANDPATTPPT